MHGEQLYNSMSSFYFLTAFKPVTGIQFLKFNYFVIIYDSDVSFHEIFTFIIMGIFIIIILINFNLTIVIT